MYGVGGGVVGIDVFEWACELVVVGVGVGVR